MEGALFGTETEYACAGSLAPAEAAIRVKEGIFAARKYGLIEPARTMPMDELQKALAATKPHWTKLP